MKSAHKIYEYAYGYVMEYIYTYANDMRATLITLVSTVWGDLLPPWGGVEIAPAQKWFFIAPGPQFL